VKNAAPAAIVLAMRTPTHPPREIPAALSLHDARRTAQVFAVHAIDLSSADAAVPEWVQLIPAGTFTGRDGRGPFHAGDLARVIARTQELLAGVDAVIDFDHAADLGKGTPAPAAGWIREFAIKPDGLFARVEWTERGRAAIQSREYRYLSPAFLHGKDDNAVIAVLRATLTNTPNLNILALNRQETAVDLKSLLALLAQTFGLPAESTAEAVIAHCKDVAARLGGAGNLRLQLCASLGLESQADDQALLGALGAVVARSKAAPTGAPDPAKFVPVEAVASLQKQVNDLIKAQSSAAAKTAVDTAIRNGRLIPALRDWGLQLASSDPATFASYVKAAPKVVDSQALLVGEPSGAANGLAEHEQAICRQLALSAADYAKTRKALALV
jgi:phage I-like protein